MVFVNTHNNFRYIQTRKKKVCFLLLRLKVLIKVHSKCYIVNRVFTDVQEDRIIWCIRYICIIIFINFNAILNHSVNLVLNSE